MQELFGALTKAQSELHGAKKDAVNPHLGNKYADLASCWEAIREVLAKNGLCVIQRGDIGPDGKPVLITTLGHSSGQSIEGRVPVLIADANKLNAMQALGSAWTYARRYGLAAIVGLTAEDDDGAGTGAGTPPPAARATAPAAKPAAKPATPAAPQERVAAPQANRGEPPQGEFPSNLEINQGTFTGVVQGVSKKEGTTKKGKPFVRYGVTLFGVDGIYGTFQDDEGTLATECAAKGQRVEVAWERDGKFLNLKGLMPVIQAATEEKKKDDLPF